MKNKFYMKEFLHFNGKNFVTFYSENLDLTITTNGFLNKEIIKKFHIKLFI